VVLKLVLRMRCLVHLNAVELHMRVVVLVQSMKDLVHLLVVNILVGAVLVRRKRPQVL